MEVFLRDDKSSLRKTLHYFVRIVYKSNKYGTHFREPIRILCGRYLMFYQFDVGCGFARILVRLLLLRVGIFLGFFHQEQDIAPLSQFHDLQCSPG